MLSLPLSGEKTEPAGPFFWARGEQAKARKEKSAAVKMAGDFRLSEFSAWHPLRTAGFYG